MKMATVIRDVFVLVGFVLASTTANAQEAAFSETSQLEQLQSHESAAAVEAAKIRELKASDIEPDSDRLSELEQNLNSHLDVAFDLKLQLESQISQRKQLRDKIIARRAAELVDGAASAHDVSIDRPRKPASTSVAGDGDVSTERRNYLAIHRTRRWKN